MTFWQGIALTLLANTTNIIGSDNNYDDQGDKYAKQAQNFLICLEMLGFSIAHFYCFPVEEWEEGYRPEEDHSKYGDKMALGDFLQDLKVILRYESRRKHIVENYFRDASQPFLWRCLSTSSQARQKTGPHQVRRLDIHCV